MKPINAAPLLRSACALLVAFAATFAGAARAADDAPRDLVMKGDAKCTRCHDQSSSPGVLAIAKTRHGNIADVRTPTCTTCHGESDAHVKTASAGQAPALPDQIFSKKSRTPMAERSATCMNCHEKDARRMLWAGSTHETHDVACTSCHSVHQGQRRIFDKTTQSEVCFACHKEQRAQSHRVSTHPMFAGKVACSDCHNPHGSTGPKLLAKSTVNDTCYTCHAEKRGPFLWEHPPATDDCMNCHTPHGSTNAPLLKERSPWLCQQCHGDGAPHPGNVYSAANLPGGAVANVNASTSATSAPVNPLTGARIGKNSPSAQMAFRGCSNCHSQVHGSNHPGGNRFLR